MNMVCVHTESLGMKTTNLEDLKDKKEFSSLWFLVFIRTRYLNLPSLGLQLTNS